MSCGIFYPTFDTLQADLLSLGFTAKRTGYWESWNEEQLQSQHTAPALLSEGYLAWPAHGTTPRKWEGFQPPLKIFLPPPFLSVGP